MYRRQRLLTEKSLDNQPSQDKRIRVPGYTDRVGTEPVASCDGEDSIQFRIKVCVRIRPFSSRESNEAALTVQGKQSLELDFNQRKQKSYNFSFDRVYDPSETTRTIYSQFASDLTGGLLEGFNSSMFAYGATGSGKTFTMFGNDNSLGITHLCLQDIFDQIEPQIDLSDFLVKMTCVELYNENLFDLLSDTLNAVQLRESPSKGVFLSGASQVIVSTFKDASKLLRKVVTRRQTQATVSNESSSRSHAIIQVFVQQKQKCQGLQQQLSFSKLSLIDLAGSQKSGTSLNPYQSKKINQSLLVLSNCIHELAKNSERGSRNHIPFRDSKLTRMLKDSLGGNTRTVMVSCVSPSIVCSDQTYNTLVYSSYTNKIEMKVKRNSRKVDKTHVSDYTRIIIELRAQNQRIRQQLGPQYEASKHQNHKLQLQRGFQQQIQVRQKLLQVQSKLQALQFDQFKTLYTNSKCQKMFKPGNGAQIQRLKQLQHNLTQQYNQIKQHRRQIINQLKPAGKHGLLQYINNKVLQFQIKQLKQEKIQQTKKNTQLEAQRVEVNILLDQLKKREKIISMHNKVLGQPDNTRPYLKLSEQENQTTGRGSDQKWFYNFLDSLEKKDAKEGKDAQKQRKTYQAVSPVGQQALPLINRLRSQGSNLSSNHSNSNNQSIHNTPSLLKVPLPMFRKASYKAQPDRRARSKSIRNKTQSQKLQQVSKNEYSQFLQKNISRYQSYKSRKI